MLSKPNEAQLKQLSRLNTQEFAHLTGYFEQELTIIGEKLLTAGDRDVMFRLQGRGQSISELLALIRKAPELVTRKHKQDQQTE